VAEEAVKYPVQFPINDRLKARIGYRDSRVEIEYNTRVPLVGWYTLRLDPADMPLVDRVFLAQDEWIKLSMRKPKTRAVVEMPISKNVTARLGFEDRHVEIVVKVVVVNYTITLQEAETPKVREAFAAQKRWIALPEFERYIKGAA
jgi:hypothetical protein